MLTVNGCVVILPIGFAHAKYKVGESCRNHNNAVTGIRMRRHRMPNTLVAPHRSPRNNSANQVYRVIRLIIVFKQDLHSKICKVKSSVGGKSFAIIIRCVDTTAKIDCKSSDKLMNGSVVAPSSPFQNWF